MQVEAILGDEFVEDLHKAFKLIQRESHPMDPAPCACQEQQQIIKPPR